MNVRKAAGIAAVCVLALLPAATVAGGKFDGNWTTHMSCEAPRANSRLTSLNFRARLRDNVFHGQHGEENRPGYLVIDGKIKDDGTAKL